MKINKSTYKEFKERSQMTKKAILPKLFVAMLLFGVLAFVGCEGSADKSLTINAFPPVNQSTNSISVMDDIFKIRLSAFQNNLGDYYSTGDYKLDNIVKDYLYCSTTKNSDGEWSELSCERCTDGSCKPASPDDTVLQKINSCKATGTTCEATNVLNDERTNVLELPELLGDAEDPFVYAIEGYGNLNVVSTTQCTKTSQCETGWECQNGQLFNLFNLETCVRTVDTGIVARGVSAPTIYNGEDPKSIDVMFGLVTKVGFLSTADGNLVELNSPRTGHKSVGLPDGKVLVIGGEAFSNGTKDFNIPAAELYDPFEHSFKEVTVSGWTGGRSFFTLNEIEDVTPTENITEVKFVIIGGQSSQGVYNEVLLGTYDMATESLSFTALPALGTPVMSHTATTLDDGRILIVGGISNQNAVVGDSYILDAEMKTLTPTSGSMTEARYGHTATLMPSGKVVIVGGMNNRGYTTDNVEVFDPETETFSSYDYGDDEEAEKAKALTSRFGHIAIPLAQYNPDGSVTDTTSARVAIYGGYRYEESEEDTNQKYYYNSFSVDSTSDVIVAFVNDEGMVSTYPWSPSRGYIQYMDGYENTTNHPTVESEWKFLGDSKDTVVVVGGRSNDNQNFSSWVEVLRFIKDSEGYQFGKFQFGPDEALDVVSTPFRSSFMGAIEVKPVGRYGMSLAKMSNGNIMITGGNVNSNGVVQSIKTSEVYFTPSQNSWGGIPTLMSDF